MTAPIDLTAITKLITTDTTTTPLSDPPTKPRRLFLFTHPRSASNLLIRILSLPTQPSLFSRKHGGYYFFPLLFASADLKCTYQPLDTWTPEDRAKIHESYQKCFDDLEADVRSAEEREETIFVKDHACFMAEPVALARWRFPGEASSREEQWTVKVPERYGRAASTEGLLEHSPLNITALPDAYLMQWHPTFLIRHPALAIPSYRRATKATAKRLESDLTLRWQRMLYDFYDQRRSSLTGSVDSTTGEKTEQNAEWPLVIDADDVMHTPAVLDKWCALSGLDTSKLQREWAPLSDEEKAGLSDVARKFTVTLSGSTGVVEGKSARGVFGTPGKEWDGVGDWEGTEVSKWTEEFGEETTQWMVGQVRGTIGDYKFLRDRRLGA